MGVLGGPGAEALFIDRHKADALRLDPSEPPSVPVSSLEHGVAGRSGACLMRRVTACLQKTSSKDDHAI